MLEQELRELQIDWPQTPDIAALLKDYKGDAVIAAGEVFDSSPSNIKARTTNVDVSGVKLALLPKKTRGATVEAISKREKFFQEKFLVSSRGSKK